MDEFSHMERVEDRGFSGGLRDGDRVERMIAWIRENAQDILKCPKGRITFHFAGRDLEVEPNLKQKI